MVRYHNAHMAGFRIALFTLLTVSIASAQSTDPAGFFEHNIRPLFAKSCFSCHQQTKLGGLALTSRQSLLTGGNSGPSIIPGDPDSSLLIQAVRRSHDRIKMPPQEPLGPAEIASLEQWVRDGAVWPEAEAVPAAKSAEYVITPEQRAFWSFQPVRNPLPPPVSNQAWIKTELDRYVLAALESKGLQPAPPADQRTLLRRLYFDLIGLPPSPSEVDAFLNDSSPDAFSKVVDRLLASPQYGERWGRYWLDVARYADDQLNSTQMEPYENAFRYRNWVIQAFNDDMPYDLFVKAQIAGDQIQPADQNAAGLALFALTPKFQDDRIDALTRGFLGLTVACAQCHHHKFDPIPTEDYYALLGIFNSTRNGERPLAETETVEAWQKQKKEVDAVQTELQRFLTSQSEQLVDVLARQTASYLMAAWSALSQEKPNVKAIAETNGLSEPVLDRWIRYTRRGPRDHPLFNDWDKLRERNAPEAEVRQWAQGMEQRILDILREKRRIDQENQKRLIAGGGKENEVEQLSLPRDDFFLWRDLGSPNAFKLPAKFDTGLLHFKGEAIDSFLNGVWSAHAAKLREEHKQLEAALPPKYPFLHVIEDVKKPKNERVHIRGSAADLGAEVPRRFLQILAKPDAKPFTQGSGRLQLAEAIADPENPLTARVMVNRIWLGHFGEGIVRTPSNFGQMGDRPATPELLDYLAARFIESGWSIKTLHREILLSSTWRQSSTYNPKAFEADPENRLHWRYNRRRLDIESLRDSMLHVAGNLDPAPAGTAVELSDDCNNKRTVYGYVSRRKLEVLLGLFDFPNPVTTSERRIETNTPLQGLFFLNSGFVRKQAEALADRVAKEAGNDPAARIEALYRLLYARPPQPKELESGKTYLAANPANGWPLYAQVLLSTNEFLYIE